MAVNSQTPWFSEEKLFVVNAYKFVNNNNFGGHSDVVHGVFFFAINRWKLMNHELLLVTVQLDLFSDITTVSDLNLLKISQLMTAIPK